MKTSPLSEDAAQVEKWTAEQPNPKEGLFKVYTFDEMKSALEKWLSPEEDTVSENAFPPTTTTQTTSNFSLDTSNAKQNKVDKFDSLFDTKTDDLPF